MRSISVLALVLAFLTVSFAQSSDTAQSNGSMNGQYGGSDGSAQAPDAFFFSAGPGVLDNLKAEDWAFQFAAGKQWAVNRFFATKSLVEATTDFNEAVLASALIGANVYPVRGFITPYIGAGAGLGWARASTDADIFGLDMSGTFGLLMFQSTPIKVKVETNANFLFRELIGDQMPMTFSARVGVLF